MVNKRLKSKSYRDKWKVTACLCINKHICFFRSIKRVCWKVEMIRLSASRPHFSRWKGGLIMIVCLVCCEMNSRFWHRLLISLSQTAEPYKRIGQHEDNENGYLHLLPPLALAPLHRNQVVFLATGAIHTINPCSFSLQSLKIHIFFQSSSIPFTRI